MSEQAERTVPRPVRYAGFLIVFLILAAPLSAADDFDVLRQNASAIRTIQADFTQKKIMKILSKPLVSEGRFVFAAPDSVRWEYVRPLRSVVLSSQGQTRRYIAAGGKMVEDTSGGVKAMSIVLAEVAGWMSGRFDDNPSFTASVKDSAEETVVILTPVAEGLSRMMQRIDIVLLKRDATIRSVRIVENADAETLIDFTRVRINTELPPRVFQDVP